MLTSWAMPDDMLALLVAVLGASLLGSAHCAGMCGAFVALSVSPIQNRGAPPSLPRFTLTPTIAYNLGRLITYLVFGALAGTAGAMLDLGGSLLGLQRVAAMTTAGFMVLFACHTLLVRAGVRLWRAPVPAALLALAKRGHRFAFGLSPLKRAGLIGLLTTLLPCGWLYAFVIISAGTASPFAGTLTMLAFWLGTIPVMASLGLGVQSLAGPLRRHLPVVSTMAIISVSVWTLLGRTTMPALPRQATIASSATTAGAPHPSQSLRDAVRHADEHCPLCNQR